MRYKQGDKIKVTTKPFEEFYGDKNIWVVDHIKTQVGDYPSLYICYREDDKNKTLFYFTEKQVEKI